MSMTKRWTALSYHRVREAIAAKILEFFHIPGDENPADIVSKHWSHNKMDLMEVILPVVSCGRGTPAEKKCGHLLQE